MRKVKEMLPVLMSLALILILSTGVVYASSAGAAELDSVWDKVKAGVGGTYGKLASLGIVAASIWNREKIGMLAMGAGIIIGVMVPTLPGIIDKIGTATI